MFITNIENLVISGSLTVNSVDINGNTSTTYNIVATKTSDYTITSTVDNQINIFKFDTTSNAITVDLPAIVDENTIISIVDVGGYAAYNNITIVPNGSDTIIGYSSLIINGNRESIKMYSSLTDSEWIVM